VNALLAELGIATAELGINLVAAPEMTLINETFLQHAGSTDVITFDHANSEFRLRNPGLKLHGELFICVDDAVQQAGEFKTSWQAEVVRYVVHGVLHLLGHDDRRAGARRTMKREENRLLRGLARRFSLAQIARGSKISA
jgi:rRNA maturation RNase YbeY